MSKKIERSPPFKHQTTIGESLRWSIEVEPISYIKVTGVEEAVEEMSLMKKKRGKKVSRSALSEGKARISWEIGPTRSRWLQEFIIDTSMISTHTTS